MNENVFYLNNLIRVCVQGARCVSFNKKKYMTVLLLDIVGPITHQAVQANYHTAITHAIQYVCTAWCVIGPTITKNKHSMLKLISRLEGECGIAARIGRDALHQIFTCFRSLKGLIDKENDQCIYNLQTRFLASADITTIAL